MEDDQQQDVHARLAQLQRQVEQQHQQILTLSAQTEENQTRHRGDKPLDGRIQACIAPHLQLKPMEQADRNRIIRQYNRHQGLPEPIRDSNELGGRAVTTKDDKKWLVTHLPQLQRDAIDIIRIASAAWQAAIDIQQPQRQLDLMQAAIRDITAIASDNAQRMGKLQLQQTFEAAGAKGAYTIINLEENTADIDVNEHSLFQQAHIEALQDLKRFTTTIDTSKRQEKKPHTDNRGNRGSGRRQDFGRGNGGSFRGRGGYGFGRGRGRGEWHRNDNRNQGNGGYNSNQNQRQD